MIVLLLNSSRNKLNIGITNQNKPDTLFWFKKYLNKILQRNEMNQKH